MTLKQFENLVKINQLKLEESDQGELEGLIKSGQARLKDSHNTDLSLESRFDLAYNAAHAISLAAYVAMVIVQKTTLSYSSV